MLSQAGESAIREGFGVVDGVAQQRRENDQRGQAKDNQPQKGIPPHAFGLGMEEIQPDGDHDHDGQHANGAVAVQAKPQEQAGEDEVIAVARAQAADQVKERGRNEQRIEREAQSHAADHVRPVADASKNSANSPTRLPPISFPSRYM